ncbi:MAG: hypothetical protein AMS27_01475 [Bacteroides sp. SM23_62_1]|nr:MAG: hypothetical protein AMS27_01475 [Bacteroides sp. SM23_62_1]
MKQIGIFFGSSTGDTEKVATLIRDKIGTDMAAIHDIYESCVDDLGQYPILILGISTWGLGEMQEDWYQFLPRFRSVDFTGKKVALYGVGDQESYPDTFADGLGLLYDQLHKNNCKPVGKWPVDGYQFQHSRAERNGQFVGLVLDERNQPELTAERINTWLNSLGF